MRPVPDLSTQHWLFEATPAGDRVSVFMHCGIQRGNRQYLGRITVTADQWLTLKALVTRGLVATNEQRPTGVEIEDHR